MYTSAHLKFFAIIRFAKAGVVNDILIANQLVGSRKVQRLVSLRKIADPITTVDNAVQIDAFSKAAFAAGVHIRVLIEINVGMDRCGTAPGSSAVSLARQIVDAPGLTFAGIMG